MHLHHSSRTEDLVRVLAELVAEPVPDPTRPECIVVQGRGMERWLSMELSQRLGVWANPEFPLPRRIIERAFDCVLGPVDPSGIPFDPETVKWSVAALLPELARHDSFRPIRHFLTGDEAGTRRVQLAQRIAETLDHYLIYRPEMLRTWERGADPSWQAVLWRALVERHGPGHLASRAQAFIARLRGAAGAAPLGRGALDGFPTRVSFFGVTVARPSLPSSSNQMTVSSPVSSRLASG